MVGQGTADLAHERGEVLLAGKFEAPQQMPDPQQFLSPSWPIRQLPDHMLEQAPLGEGLSAHLELPFVIQTGKDLGWPRYRSFLETLEKVVCLLPLSHRRLGD